MLEDAQDAIRFAKDIGSADALASDRLYRKAVIMFLNIGELAKQLPQEFRAAHEEIPWKEISGMRDIAAHGYSEMDDDIIWDVVINSIPELVEFLDKHIHDALCTSECDT
jgi:uncharacterized protein with HEPN domain